MHGNNIEFKHFFVGKSTDVELLELMSELCQTPLSQPTDSQVQFHSQSQSYSQSQLFSSSQTQTVGEQLKLKLQQSSHSILSARSLFSSGSGDDEENSEEEEGEGDLDNPEKSSEKGGQEVSVDDGKDMEVDSGDDMFIAMETELDNRKFSSPVVKITSEPEQQVTPQRATARSKVDLDSQQRKQGIRTPVSPFRSFKPPRLRYKVQDETDEESEVELPISTPLASPIPPSPKSKELQSDILKELDSFGSDEVRRELDQLALTDSQFGVPYSQLQTPSSQCNTYSKSHPELEKVWNSTAAVTAGESSSETQLALKLGTSEEVGVVGRRVGQNVQLEYDMPEITASQLETSSDPLFNPLETDSPRSSLVKGHQSSLVKGSSSSTKGQSPLVMHQRTSLVKGHYQSSPTKGQQASMTSSLRKAKRQLFRKPAGGSGKGASSESGVSSRTRSKRKCKDIPQLDGNSDKPSSSSSGRKELSRKRKRTLGVQRAREKQSKSSMQPVIEAQPLEEVGSSCSEMEDQSSVPETTAEKVTASDTQEREGDFPSLAAAAPLNEGVGRGGQVLLEEDLLYGADIQCGLVETEVQESGPEAEGPPDGCEYTDKGGSSKRGEASSDASQHSTREKVRLSLSLKKSGNKTHRTRECDPDLVVMETVLNPSWRAETDSLPKDTQTVEAPSSPAKTGENHTYPEVVCSPSRKVPKRLKDQVLRRGLILKIDKLSTHVLRSTTCKKNTAAAPKKRKKSATPLSSGSEVDLSNEGANDSEREDRYKRRCQKRSTRKRWSPKFLAGMSYEQQLKKAIEMSKQTYLAESAQGQDDAELAQKQDNAESAEPLQKDDESAQWQPLPDIVQERGGGQEWEESIEPGEQLGSPLMFSPPSSDDLNRTVVEESPLREEGSLGSGILDKSDVLDKSDLDDRKEQETKAAIEEEWRLDMSICSISESPPYTSSPVAGGRGEEEGAEEILHDSHLKLQLETSLTELSSPPAQSSSPVQLTHKKTPPFDANTSFLSEDGFPCVILASETGTEAAAGDTTLPGDSTAKVTVEDSKDNAESPSLPTTSTPSKTVTGLEATTCDDNHNQLSFSDYPIISMLASPEGSESHSEADQLLSSQMDVSIDSEEDFHLSIGSSSSEEEVGGVRDSPDSLNFSTEKTSQAVRFGPYVSPKESLYQAKGAKDHSSHVEVYSREGETAASRVITLGSGDGSELAPPTPKELAESASSYILPSMQYQEPFYSCPADVQRPL